MQREYFNEQNEEAKHVFGSNMPSEFASVYVNDRIQMKLAYSHNRWLHL